MEKSPAWASPVEPQIRPTMPMTRPTTELRWSPWMLWLSWLPTTGNSLNAELRSDVRADGSWASTRLRIETSTSSSGNTAMKAE